MYSSKHHQCWIREMTLWTWISSGRRSSTIAVSSSSSLSWKTLRLETCSSLPISASISRVLKTTLNLSSAVRSSSPGNLKDGISRFSSLSRSYLTRRWLISLIMMIRRDFQGLIGWLRSLRLRKIRRLVSCKNDSPESRRKTSSKTIILWKPARDFRHSPKTRNLSLAQTTTTMQLPNLHSSSTTNVLTKFSLSKHMKASTRRFNISLAKSSTKNLNSSYVLIWTCLMKPIVLMKNWKDSVLKKLMTKSMIGSLNTWKIIWKWKPLECDLIKDIIYCIALNLKSWIFHFSFLCLSIQIFCTKISNIKIKGLQISILKNTIYL